MPAAAADDNTS